MLVLGADRGSLELVLTLGRVNFCMISVNGHPNLINRGCMGRCVRVSCSYGRRMLTLSQGLGVSTVYTYYGSVKIVATTCITRRVKLPNRSDCRGALVVRRGSHFGGFTERCNVAAPRSRCFFRRRSTIG